MNSFYYFDSIFLWNIEDIENVPENVPELKIREATVTNSSNNFLEVLDTLIVKYLRNASVQ